MQNKQESRNAHPAQADSDMVHTKEKAKRDTEDDSASEPHRFSVSVSKLPSDSTTVDRKRSNSHRSPRSPPKPNSPPKQSQSHQSIPPAPHQTFGMPNMMRMQQQASTSMTHLHNGSNSNPQQTMMQQMKMKQQSASMRYIPNGSLRAMQSAPYIPPPPSTFPPSSQSSPSSPPQSPARDKRTKRQNGKKRHTKTLPHSVVNAQHSFPPPPPDPSPTTNSPFNPTVTRTSSSELGGLPRPPAFTYAPDSIDRASAASNDSNATNRVKAVKELIDTERSYVNQLEMLLSLYADKLSHQVKIMSAEDHRIVFPPSLRIIKNLNSKLLADLTGRQTTCGDDSQLIISDIIVDYAPHFRMYQKYMANSSVQLQRLTKCLDNSKFFQFQQKMRKKFKNLGLTDLIIMPVQRIPRYKLLLQEIVKRTESDHPDFNGLKEALALIEQVNAENNETLKDFDARMRVLCVMNEIEKAPNLASPARRFVYSGELWKIKVNGKLEREMFYLFNDCLVYATPKSFGTKNLFKMRIPIDSAFSVQNLKNTQKYKNMFALYSSLESIMLSTKEDGTAKREWIGVLLECADNARSGHYFHSNSSSARMGRGSVLIARAKLQIPKTLKKELNKELAVIHMPQTLESPSKRSMKKHQRFGTQQQIDLLTLTTNNDPRFTLSTDSKPGTFSEDEEGLSDDEKDFFKSAEQRQIRVTPLRTSQSHKMFAASSPKQYKSRTPTASTSPDGDRKVYPFPESDGLNLKNVRSPPRVEVDDDEFVGRQRSRSFGGSTSLKSASEYHKKPHHHVPAVVVPQLSSIQDAKAKLRPKSAVKFKPLPLIQSNSSDAAPKTIGAVATSPPTTSKVSKSTKVTPSSLLQKNATSISPKRKLPQFPVPPLTPPIESPPTGDIHGDGTDRNKTLLWRNADCNNMDNRLLFGKMRKRVRDTLQFADNHQLLDAMKQKIGNGRRVMVVANAQDEVQDHELVKTIRHEMKYQERILVFNNARGVYRAPWVSKYDKVTLTQSEHALMSHIKTFADSEEMESAPSSPTANIANMVSTARSQPTPSSSSSKRQPEGIKKKSSFKLNGKSAVIKKAATFSSMESSRRSQSKGVSEALAVINRNKKKFKSFEEMDMETTRTSPGKVTDGTSSKTKVVSQSKTRKPFTGDPTIWNAYLDAHGGSEPTNEWMLHKFVKSESTLPTISFKQAREMYKGCKGGGRI